MLSRVASKAGKCILEHSKFYLTELSRVNSRKIQTFDNKIKERFMNSKQCGRI